MLSTAAPTIVGMSDTTRPLLLIGFVVFMFGIAGLAIFLGKRRIEMQQAKALSGDTGVLKGATRGADTTFDDAWLAETRAEAESEGPRQSWADAILGPGALHEDLTDDGLVLPPEIRAQRESATATHDSAWASNGEWSGHAADDTSGWDAPSPEPETAYGTVTADEPVAPEFPAYLQSEVEAPVYAQPETDMVTPAYEPVAPQPEEDEVPAYLRSELDTPAPVAPGKHAARPVTVDKKPSAPFLVDSGLDDDDED